MHAMMISLLDVDASMIGVIGFGVVCLAAAGLMIWWIVADSDGKPEKR